MTVNGVDVRKYEAKQLTVDIQPPDMAADYEWITGALLPKCFKKDIKMGHLKLCVYFRGKSRNDIIRRMSLFMENLTNECEIKLDGYKGIYKGILTADDYEKTIVRQRYKLNLEFDGYFYDDEIKIEFDGVTSGVFHMMGSRRTPCILEIHAKDAIENYTISMVNNRKRQNIISLNDDNIVISRIEAGETITVDGIKGLVTDESGINAFARVSLWEFPSIQKGETILKMSSNKAKVTVRYNPMWI